VHQAEGIFDQYWNSPVVIPIGTLSKQSGIDRAALRQRLVDQVKAENSRPYLDHVRARSDLAVALDDIEMHFSDTVRVISDPPERALRDKDERWLRNLLSPLLRPVSA
jgi:cardiolipin synthase C